MINGVTLAVEIGSIRTMKDGSVSLTVCTPELSEGQAGEIFGLRNKVAFCYISPREIKDNDKKILDSLDPELKGKTPGQRLRNVLFVAWQQSPDGYKDSESYYKAKMESIINSIKAELNP
jgi:hypothetical protein